VEINEAFKGTLHGNQKAQMVRDQWQFGRNNKKKKERAKQWKRNNQQRKT
jgi:hypothetical protein